MIFSSIKNFKNGWIVGNFTPSLFPANENDIGVLFLDKGHKSDTHYHKLHTEYNVIIKGKVLISNINEIKTSGDIFIFEPNDRSYLEYLEDTILLVIKNPSTNGDKYY
jgi:quercetin dioxygenase-like cupin family protein